MRGISVKVVDKYEAYDGTVFDTIKECEEYEKDTKKRIAFYDSIMSIFVYWNGWTKEDISDPSEIPTQCYLAIHNAEMFDKYVKPFCKYFSNDKPAVEYPKGYYTNTYDVWKEYEPWFKYHFATEHESHVKDLKERIRELETELRHWEHYPDFYKQNTEIFDRIINGEKQGECPD